MSLSVNKLTSRIGAVIDFGSAGAGDPAADGIAAWSVFGPDGRAVYRHSLPEESEALTAAATVLQTLKQDDNSAQLVTGNTVAGLLLQLHEAGLIDPYVLFSLGDDGIARDYKAFRAVNRAKLEEYMDKFVMPPAPAGK